MESRGRAREGFIATDLVDEARDALSKFADFALSVLNLMKGGLLDRPEGFGLNWVQPSIEKWSNLKQVLDATKTSASAAVAAVEGGAAQGGAPLPKPRPLDAPDLRRPATRVPVSGGSSSSGADSVDRAIASLNKHIEATEADAAAVGQGTAALARFRAEAAETAAVQANGGKETAKQAEAFKLLQDGAAAAAGALAQARIDSQISFGRQTALLSETDVSIAQQLSAKFGNDIPAAMASSEAAALRFNNALHQISSSIDSNITTGLADIIDGTKSAAQGFADMGKSILRMLEQAAIKAAIVQPLMSSLGLGLSGGGVGLLSLLPKFASGTDSAPGGLAIVGERGPELVNLPRGSQVIPNNIVAKRGSSRSGPTNISYSIDARGADSGTVERIKTVLSQHARAISGQERAMKSAQRFQATGVG